jgi:F-type H+-transporting ATPase subunit gamma
MKMVAAAKLRRSQERVEGGRPYMKLLQQMIVNASQANSQGSASQSGETSFTPIQGSGKVCLVFTSDRGLCGSFNGNVIKAAVLLRRADPEMQFVLFGKKVIDYFRKQQWPTLLTFPSFFQNFSWETAAQSIETILSKCREQNIGELSAIYTRFLSAGVQRLDRRTIFPFKVEAQATATSMMLIEPNRELVVAELVRLYSRFSFFHIAAEVIASEHGARMTAMDAATRNAKDMIDRLTLEMNRARQANITKELLEIIGGKEALE